jgi:hypothetical protein
LGVRLYGDLKFDGTESNERAKHFGAVRQQIITEKLFYFA